MTYDPHNLVRHTVQAIRVFETARCEVGSKPSPWSYYLEWNEYHRWPAGERATGACLNCGKTLKQVQVRLIPKKVKAERVVASTIRWTEDGKRVRA